MNRLRTAITTQLAQELAHGDLTHLPAADATITLLLDSTTTFTPGSSDMTWPSRELVTKLGQAIKWADRARLHVVGHTDDEGSASTNLRLSERQAQAIMEVLASSGIDRHRMRAEGQGEFAPAVSNITPAGRRHNRRVEIHLTPIPTPSTRE